MAKMFEADLLGPSVLHSRQGLVDATHNRLNSFVDKFRAMREARHNIPLFWGHQMQRGTPAHSDDAATERARWRAGEIGDVRINPNTGRLRISATVPPGCEIDPEDGSLIDPVNHTRIREVSAGIGDWLDGNGQQWEDAIVHVALTPLPAWVWQDGFTEAGSEQLLALSAGSNVVTKYVLGSNMPALKSKPGTLDDEDDVLADAGETETTDEMPGAEEEAAAMPAEGEDGVPAEMTDEMPAPGPDDAPMEDEPAADPNAPPADESSLLPPEEAAVTDPAEQLLPLLAQLGVELPEGTTSENVIDRLIGTISGLLASGARISVGGEHDLGGAGGGLGGAQVEPPPLFTLSAGDPSPSGLTERERLMAEHMAGGERDRLRARCDAAVAAGIPADIVAGVREKHTRVHLSLDSGAVKVTLPDAEPEISLLEKLAERVGPLLTATLAAGDPSAKAINNPARGDGDSPYDDEQFERLRETTKKIYGPDAEPARVK